MQLSLIVLITLLLMGFFSLLHISIFFDIYRQSECYDEASFIKCNFILQKIYIVLFSSLCTLVIMVLQPCIKVSKLLLVNAIVGAVAVLSVLIYLIALLTNDNFKNLSKIYGEDFAKYYQEQFVYTIMIEFGFTTGITILSYLSFQMKESQSEYTPLT